MGYWVLRYDLAGNFVSQKKIPFRLESIAPISNNGFVVYSNYRNNKRKLKQEYNIIYLDSLMHITKAFFPYNSNNYSNPTIKFTTPAEGSFYTYNTKKHFYSHYNKYVYEVTDSGLKPKYFFDFGSNTINEEYLHQKKILKSYLAHGEFYGLENVFENDDLVIFSFYQSSSPIGHFGFYSKKSGNSICSTGLSLGKKSTFSVSNKLTYDSWIIATIKPEQLLSWKENIDKNKTTLESEYARLKMAAAEKISREDNEVLMCYKLKPF